MQLLLPQKEKTGGTAQEVQNAAAIHLNGEEGIQHRDHQQSHAKPLRQRQHREQHGDADHGDVPQQPEPQHGLGFEIIRIDKHGDFSLFLQKENGMIHHVFSLEGDKHNDHDRIV